MVVQDAEVEAAAFRVLFEHVSDGVLFADSDGTLTAANPAACALLEMSAEAICALHLDGLVDPDDPRWQLARAEQNRSATSTGVVRVRRGDGRFKELEVTTRLFDDEHASGRVLAMLHDITGRVAIEREIEELSARLLQLSRVDDLTGFQNRRGLIAVGTQI